MSGLASDCPSVIPGAGLRHLVSQVRQACAAPMDEMSERMTAALGAVIGDADLVSPQARRASPDRYARHMLYADPGGRFTLVALVWMPGQFSPVHGHHAWCAYAVHAGELTEASFGYDPAGRTATPTGKVVQAQGAISFGYAGLDNIHKLGNGGDNDAVSVHVYGLDGARVGTHLNRLVPVAAQA